MNGALEDKEKFEEREMMKKRPFAKLLYTTG